MVKGCAATSVFPCTYSYMGKRRGAYKVLVMKPQEGDHLKEPGIDGRILLKGIFEKWEGQV
jgi:hypothetical protein